MDPFAQWEANIKTANGGDTGNMYQNAANAAKGIDSSQAGVVVPQAQVNAATDQVVASNAAAAEKVQAQRESDATDPSKAQMKLLPNNQGYAFYDGTGQPININQYSLLTNKTPAQLLANSPNPKDQKFVQDYNTLQTLTNAWVNGDTGTLDQMRAADPKKFNALISTYKTPADMVKAFTQHWSDYYSTPQGGGQQTDASQSFGPQTLYNPKGTAATQAGSLSQVLTPQPSAPPTESFVDKIDPWSAKHKAVNAYNAQIKANPWFAYNNQLYGS